MLEALYKFLWLYFCGNCWYCLIGFKLWCQRCSVISRKMAVFIVFTASCCLLTSRVVLCLLAALRIKLCAGRPGAGNGWPHNALQYHELMPISCHFRDCKVLLVTSLTRVSSAATSTRLCFALHCHWPIQTPSENWTVLWSCSWSFVVNSALVNYLTCYF